MINPVSLNSVHVRSDVKLTNGWSNASVSNSRSRSHTTPRTRGEHVWRDIESALFTATAVLVLSYLCLAAVWHTGPFTAESLPTKSIALTVAPGDTLWSLSEHVLPNGGPLDRRLAQIRALNPSLDTSAPLQPGTVLRMPCSNEYAVSAAPTHHHHHARHARHLSQRVAFGS